MAGIFVLAELREPGKFKKITFELLSKARELGQQLNEEVYAVLLGEDVSGATAELFAYGAKKVFAADDAKLKDYTTDPYTDIVANLLKEQSASVFLAGFTSTGKDLAPRVAQRLAAGLASDCINLEVDGGKLVATRPVMSGKAFAKLAFKSKPALATVRPNSFAVTSLNGGGQGETVTISVPGDIKTRTKVLEVSKSASTRPELTEAEIIVSGGRGIKGPENFPLLEELADTIGAAVGASRAVVDAGWRPHSDQVGQTGKTVSPVLYLAFGISGAIQHLAGMSSSKVIVAINKDAEAPIFKAASYGIVGDLFQIAPALKEEFKKLKEQG